MRKIGINFRATAKLDEREFAKLASELGFGACFTGMYPDVEHHKKVDALIREYGMTHDFIHSDFGKINDMWLPTPEGEEMDRELRRSVDRAALLEVPVVVVHLSSGNNPPPVTDLGRARYEALVDYAEEKGVIIAFENLRKLANVAWAFETFADRDCVRFCWDCGHENCYTPNIEFMPIFGEKLICTHLHDNRGTFCDDDHRLPFDGTVNFERVAEHLRKSPFKGTIMLEVGHRDPIYDGISGEEFLQRAADAVKRIREMVEG